MLENEAFSAHQSHKSQSAMEYLMTYGWAILIIAVVLGALYSLGVFNAVNFMPKVPGGGCHVFRPNGPGTSWNVNLVGSCNNALPQYVAQFNGQSSHVTMQQQISQETGTNPMTFALWFNPASVKSNIMLIADTYGSPRNGYDLYSPSSDSFYMERFWSGGGKQVASTGALSPNTWYFIVDTYDGNTMTLYLNGVQKGTPQSSTNSITVNEPLIIGGGSSSTYLFGGSIANVQVYNTSLTANQVQYLYNEGIGGVPISPQYLVGWWPLNGDTTDYSGNNNNGAATAITFNGTWTGGYNVP